MNPEQVELWRRTLTLITEHPETHYQGTWLNPFRNGGSDALPDGPLRVDADAPWTCGTAGCLAGNAVLLDGRHALRVNVGELEIRLPDGAWDDLEYRVRGVAAALLGLRGWEAEVAFDGFRTLTELWAVAEVVTEGAVSADEVPADRRRWTDDELRWAREDVPQRLAECRADWDDDDE